LFIYKLKIKKVKQKHIYIIGGGPAGSATAVSLANLVIRNAHPLQITQVCGADESGNAIGETIPPAASEYLRKLNLEELLNGDSHLMCPGSMSIWGQSQAGFNDFFITPVGKGYHLDRKIFNKSLREAAKSRAVNVMHTTKLTGIEKDNDLQWQLTLDTPNGTVKKTADFVVDATGIQARIARNIGVARNQYDSVISACAIYKLDKKPTKAAHTLVSTVKEGWWYGTQLPNNYALVSFCTDAQTLKQLKIGQSENWFKLLNQSDWFYKNCCDQFETELKPPNKIDLRVAPSAILSCVVGNNWLAVGDAASSYDSMTSAGITKALQQGLAAGIAINQLFTEGNAAGLKVYQQDVFNSFNQYLKLHQTLYHREQRFIDSKFWQRRQLTS
jgi:flavin-dependent dehydrogenase